MSAILNAHALAACLHAGQTDLRGEPYIGHLAAVVRILLAAHPDAPAHAIEAAWLHDALEDTEATPDSLLAAGVSPEAMALVQRLTRPLGSVYLDWIRDLAASGDVWAIRIKLADNAHNSMPGRAIPHMVACRYAPARRILEGEG